jgi:hypothetical protein
MEIATTEFKRHAPSVKGHRGPRADYSLEFAGHTHPIGRYLCRTMQIHARRKGNAGKSWLHTTVCFGDGMTCAE